MNLLKRVSPSNLIWISFSDCKRLFSSKSMPFLAAIDQGTSSSRFLIFNSTTGKLVVDHQIPVNQLTPQTGYVEMCPNEIYKTVVECIDKGCQKFIDSGYKISDIKAIGLANQRETTVVWDKNTSEPLFNAIVWLDTRTSTLASKFIDKTPNKDKDFFKSKTGLPIHPYFSALKLRWLIDNVDEVKKAYDNDTLLVGTVDSWLIWKLTGIHATDVTNASRTLLLDLGKRKWSDELTTFFDIKKSILPEIKSSAENFGYFKDGPLINFPLTGVVGDQQAAMIGHNCLNIGDCKSTYGTGTFLLCNIGYKPVVSNFGLITTVGYQFGPNAPIVYAVEGSGSIGGNVIRFLRDNLSFINNIKECEELANSVQDTDGVYFVPCFSGLYTPYWDSTARGIICGLTQSSTKAHITRAALKGVAFQTEEMISAIENDFENLNVNKLRIDGGMTFNKTFVQMQADVLGKEIDCPSMCEISGFGAAITAGIGVNIIDVEEYKKFTHPSINNYKPLLEENCRILENKKWRDAVSRARNWM
uniref:Probable glycerol kinase n=1 Tax=Strongyloides papillosus TaxID=174720 RepID=A0A0N5CDF3_STREA